MATADLSILIKAKNDASSVFKTVERDASSLGSKMGTALKAGGLVAAAGIGAAGFALVGFVKMAAQEQAGIERLKTSIASTGVAYEDYAKQIDATVRAGEKLAFQDDEVRDSLSALTIATGSVVEATNRQKIAMDLARGTGMDLAMASKLVGKVSEENTQVLKRYGITLADGATETEALAEIQKRFAGQSETFAGTATAKWAIFNNQMDNVKESIGGALLPVVTQLGTALGDFLTRHQADIDHFSQMMAEKIPQGLEEVKRLFMAIKPELAAVVQQFKDAWPTIQTGLQWVIDNKPVLIAAIIAIGAAMLIALTPVTAPILAIVAALALLTIAIGMNEQDWKEFGDTVDQVWDDMQVSIEDHLGGIGIAINSGLDSIRNQWTTQFLVLRDIGVIVLALINGDWSKAWDGLKQLARDAMSGITTEIAIVASRWREIFGLAMLAAHAAILAVWDLMRLWFLDLPFAITTAIGDLAGVLYELGKNALQGFLNGIKDAAMGIPGAIHDHIISPTLDTLHLGFLDQSPSRVTMDIGKNVAAGLAVGLEQGSAGIFGTLDRLLADVRSRVAEISATASQARSSAGSTGQGGLGPANPDVFSREEKRYINEVARQRGEPIPFPGYAMGGIVTRSGLAMVEVGEEIRKPNDVRTGRGGGGMVFNNVTFNLPNVRRPEDFGRELLREQDRMFRGVA